MIIAEVKTQIGFVINAPTVHESERTEIIQRLKVDLKTNIAKNASKVKSHPLKR